MKITDEDYSALYKRVFLDWKFYNPADHTIDENGLKEAVLAATETTEHPCAEGAWKLATEWFRSPRGLGDRLRLFFDIMKMLEEAKLD